jgi:hypothetical protein
VYEADARGASAGAEPANVLTWQPRGLTTGGPSVPDLLAEFARRQGASVAGAGYRALYTADTDSGVQYTLGQVWLRGDSRANTVLYATGGTAGAELVDYGYTPSSPAAVLGVVRHLPGTSVDLLVVVPRPGTGQVSYDDDGTGAFRPVADGRSDLNGIGLVDRAKDATDDRLELLDGDGNTDHPLYRGPVATFLELMH